MNKKKLEVYNFRKLMLPLNVTLLILIFGKFALNIS